MSSNPTASTSYIAPSAAHQALSAIQVPLSRSKSASAASTLFATLNNNNSTNGNASRRSMDQRRGSVGSVQMLNDQSRETIETLHVPQPLSRSTSTARHTTSSNTSTGYLEAKVVILGSQG